MSATLRRVLADDSGQGLVEYGLILALVAVACVAALNGLAGKIQTTLQTVGNAL